MSCIGANFKRDPARWMPPAGLVLESGAQGSLISQASGPPTPDKVRPYRKSALAKIGGTSLHFGIARDAPPPDMSFGRKNEYDCSVAQCLSKRFALDQLGEVNAEKRYISHKKEPLGKSAMSDLVLPEYTKRPGFAYGATTKGSEMAKAIIYSSADKEPNRKSKTDPGVQKSRDYDWDKVNVDPSKFRFGAVTSVGGETTKKLLQAPFTTAELTTLPLQQHRSVASAHLGQTKNLGFGSRGLDSTSVYGKSLPMDSYQVKELISGIGSAEQPVDDTLGRPVCKSVTLRKQRLEDVAKRTSAETPDHTFGCPSVRLDLRCPKQRKIATNQNFGDDPAAVALLYPSPYAASGIHEDAFKAPVTLEKAQLTCRNAKIAISDAQIKAAYTAAQKKYKTELVSFAQVSEFMDDE